MFDTLLSSIITPSKIYGLVLCTGFRSRLYFNSSKLYTFTCLKYILFCPTLFLNSTTYYIILNILKECMSYSRVKLEKPINSAQPLFRAKTWILSGIIWFLFVQYKPGHLQIRYNLRTDDWVCVFFFFTRISSLCCLSESKTSGFT